MSFKFTLGLLIVAIVAVLGFMLAQQRVPSTSPGEAAATPTPVLLDFSPAEVSGVQIGSGDRVTELAKSGSAWKLVKPSEDLNVDQAKVTRLVGQLAHLSGSRSVAKPGEDLTPYGLKSPILSVTLSNSSGKKETLLVGDKTINGNEHYAMRQEGSDVSLVPTSLVTTLQDMAANPPRATPTPSAAPSASAAAGTASAAAGTASAGA